MTAEAEAPLEERAVHLEEAVEGVARHGEEAVVVSEVLKEARRPSSYDHADLSLPKAPR